MGRTSSTLEFVNKARKIHDDRYIYSKVEYIQWNKVVVIICKVHGDF
jgi:hypothetical protein